MKHYNEQELEQLSIKFFSENPEYENKKKERIVIRVQGGMVQEVYSDSEDVELTIVDEDSDVESADEVWESIDIPKYQIY